MSADLETQTHQEEAQIAFEIESQVKRAIRKGREALWELSEALYEFDECHGWLKLGYESLSDWLADPEVTMTLGSYRRMVRTWRKLVVERKIEPTRLRELEQSKVAIVVDKIAKNEVLVDEAFADVDSLGARDLREKYYGRRASNVGQPEAEMASAVVHEPEDRYGEPGWDMETPVSDEIDAAADDQRLDQEGTDSFPEQPEGVQDDGSHVEPELEVLVGEVLDAYEYPGWITPVSVEKLRKDFEEAVYSGASWPRCDRRDCQVAVELAKAWLATHQS